VEGLPKRTATVAKYSLTDDKTVAAFMAIASPDGTKDDSEAKTASSSVTKEQENPLASPEDALNSTIENTKYI